MKIDLSTRYLSLDLKNPIVASAGPATGDLDTLKRLEQAGVAAAVLPSLFEEQITHHEQQLDNLYEFQTYGFAESLTYFPEMEEYDTGPKSYLNRLEAAKQAVSIPIIGSLNGASPGGWTRYAKAIEEAGADALELNIYFIPTDPEMSAASVVQQHIDLVAMVRETISIPLSVKLGPNFSSLPNFASRLVVAGADGLVLFNRYLEPDIDLETLQITPHLILSTRHEIRASLRWIAILRDQLSISLAASSGVHFAEDAIKLLLVGADVVMMTSALLKHGADYAQVLIEQIHSWLEVHEYKSIEQLKGSMSRGNCSEPSNLERANYMKALISFSTN
jgi:dihydroorotate dehydrogenase (fumarate)